MQEISSLSCNNVHTSLITQIRSFFPQNRYYFHIFVNSLYQYFLQKCCNLISILNNQQTFSILLTINFDATKIRPFCKPFSSSHWRFREVDDIYGKENFGVN